jgi:hypothetical protein
MASHRIYGSLLQVSKNTQLVNCMIKDRIKDSKVEGDREVCFAKI